MQIDDDRKKMRYQIALSSFLLLVIQNGCRSCTYIHTYIQQSTGNISANIIVMIIASVHQTYTYTQEKQTTHACVHARICRHTCLTFFD